MSVYVPGYTKAGRTVKAYYRKKSTRRATTKRVLTAAQIRLLKARDSETLNRSRRTVSKRGPAA